MTIDIGTAHRLFQEAADFYSGRVLAITEDSELRVIAKATYGHAFVTTIRRVCEEIFYVIACEHMAHTLTDHIT